MKEYTTPQEAPWPVGTKLRYIGDSVSGFPLDNGDTVWSHKKGVIYTVTKIRESLGIDRFTDEQTGEVITTIMHGWSGMQSELDPDYRHGKAIDVDSMNEFEVMNDG